MTGTVMAILSACAALIFGEPSLAADLGKEFIPDEVVNANAYYPEGPQLTQAGLLVAEMPRGRIVLLGGGAPKVVWQTDGCGPTSVKRIANGGYWILCHLGHYVLRVDDAFNAVRKFAETASGRRITWPNDASVDSRGNLYLSSSGRFSLDVPAEGRVVFIDLAASLATDVASGIRYSNGVLVQENLKRVLVSEHLSGRVLAFPLLDKGRLGERSVFFDFKDTPQVRDRYRQSGPDGIAVFADGDIAVADYGNGRLVLMSSDGRFKKQIPLPLRFVTNMAITPDQHFIYVTMTRDNLSAQLEGQVQRFRIRAVKD